MNWIILIAIAVLAYSSQIFVDNYISDYYFKGNGAVSQKMFFAFAQVIFGLILGIITFFTVGIDFAGIDAKVFILLLLSGFFASIASIFYYKALELNNSTDFGIFSQISPVLYLIFGWLLLGQTIDLSQAIAFAIIILAPLLIIFTSHKKSRKVQARAALFVLLYVAITVISNIIFVKEDASAAELSFFAECALLFIGKGLGNFAIMAISPKLRKRFSYVTKTSHKKVLRPLTASFLCSVANNMLRNAALIIAPSVAIVSAVNDSATPIVIFFMGIILTLIWPKFGREKLDRKTIIIHAVATFLVVIGLILIKN